MISGGIAPGWYPDYEAPAGHERYWDGERWTEQRASAPAGSVDTLPPAERRPPPAPEPPRSRATWVRPALVGLGGLAALVALVLMVLRLTDDGPDVSGSGSAPPPASTPGLPSDGSGSEDEPGPQRLWPVASVLDGSSFELTNGAQVRLLGVTDSCGSAELAQLVVDQSVTLTRKGADRDVDGLLLRYVDREGIDVGKRLIQRGLAHASDDPNPRGAIYRRIDDRSPDVCP